MKKLLVVSLVLALSLVLASSVLADGKKKAKADPSCEITLPKFVTLVPTPKHRPCKMPTDKKLEVTLSEFATIRTIEPLAKGDCKGICPLDPCNPCAPCLSWSAKWVCGILQDFTYWRPIKTTWFCYPFMKPRPVSANDITIVVEEQDI